MDKKFSFVQISDLHITEYRNLLEPMIDLINSESVDFVVVTGDLAHRSDDDTIKLAADAVNKISHKVIVIPGDYDNGAVWSNYFGDRYKSLSAYGTNFEFIDTSFVRHRFSVGWADVMAEEDPQQYEWLADRLKLSGYHIIFSHHPFWVRIEEGKRHEFLTDNLRAIYSGHLHKTATFYFTYDKPQGCFSHGFSTVPMNFHGNACYVLVSVNNNDEIINVPKMIGIKRTAW